MTKSQEQREKQQSAIGSDPFEETLEITEEIQAISSEIAQASQKLRGLEEKYARSVLRLFKSTHGVEIGCLVRCTARGRFHEVVFKVADIDKTLYTAKPWVTGQQRIAPGKYSGALTQLYDDWEVIEQ